jgi:hypothetical protein
MVIWWECFRCDWVGQDEELSTTSTMETGVVECCPICGNWRLTKLASQPELPLLYS